MPGDPFYDYLQQVRGYGAEDQTDSQSGYYTPELFGGSGPAQDAYIPSIGRQGMTAQTNDFRDLKKPVNSLEAARITDNAKDTGGKTYQATPGKIANYIREAATKRGIDPDIALRIAEHEGGYDDNEPARQGTFSTGRSWWPFQLHYGGAGTPYASWGNTAGMGNDFTERTGIQPGDPNGVFQSIDFALDHARRYGWSAWYGRGPAGVGEWDGIPR